MTRRLAATVVLVLAFSIVAVPAAPSSAFGRDDLVAGSPEEEALIKHGLGLRDKGDDEAALADFQRAYELTKSGRALAQVALAEQALGRWVDAETHLTQALGHTQDPWVARNAPLLQQALSDIQGHTGALEIAGAVPGAEIRINNQRAGTFPTGPLRVPAGSVALEIRAPHYLPLIRTVMVPARGLAREQVVLVATGESVGDGARPERAPPMTTAATGPAPTPSITVEQSGATSTSASVPAATGWSVRTKVGMGLAAGGVVALATGIAFHVVREQRASDFNHAGCGASNGDVTGGGNCPSRYDDVQGAQKLAIAGYVGAAVLGGIGAYLILGGEGASSGGVTARNTRDLRCAPAATMGLVCAARF